MVSLGRPYHFEFFKSCLPQILLGSFLNTLTHLRPCQTSTMDAQKMKFSIKDLVTFTEEILNGKLYFLCSVF